MSITKSPVLSPLRPLPTAGALGGVFETLAFLCNADFARQRIERFGDVFEARLLGQPRVFIRGGRAITDLLAHPEATEAW